MPATGRRRERHRRAREREIFRKLEFRVALLPADAAPGAVDENLRPVGAQFFGEAGLVQFGKKKNVVLVQLWQARAVGFRPQQHQRSDFPASQFGVNRRPDEAGSAGEDGGGDGGFHATALPASTSSSEWNCAGW